VHVDDQGSQQYFTANALGPDRGCTENLNRCGIDDTAFKPFRFQYPMKPYTIEPILPDHSKAKIVNSVVDFLSSRATRRSDVTTRIFALRHAESTDEILQKPVLYQRKGSF